MKSLLILILLSSLTSCGFQVLYRDNDQEKLSYEKEFSSIRIQKSDGRMSQELRVALLDLLNPDNFNVEPRYVLILSENKAISGTFITFTGASGRNKVSLTVNYELLDLQSGEIVATNSTIVNDNYDVQINRYGTYVADAYATSNLSKVAALNIRNLLANDFIEIRKASENEKEVATIFVDSSEDALVKEFSTTLQEIINKKYYACGQYYSLALDLTQTIAPSSSSFNMSTMTLNVSYVLREIKSGKIIDKESNTVSGDYAPDSSNPEVETEFRKSLIKNIVRSVQLSLVDAVSESKKTRSVDNYLDNALEACKIKENLPKKIEKGKKK